MKQYSRRFPSALPSLVLLLLFGCGGGGGDAPTPAVQGTISGSVVKGPVSGATVKAFAVSGGMPGTQLASATTDAQGNFSMSVGSYAGALMLQTAGGSYIDEASGLRMTMQSADMMSAVLPTMPAGAAVSGIQVTPLTAMAQAMASNMAGGMTADNIAAANTAMGSYFMVGDILHTVPMNPLVAGSAASATQAMKNYGMTLAAMSQYAKNAGMTASSGIVGALMMDAADGVLDGKAGSAPVAMGGGMMSGSQLQPDAGWNGLAAAMNDFMQGSGNKSGLGAAEMASLMQQMRTSGGHMH